MRFALFCAACMLAGCNSAQSPTTAETPGTAHRVATLAPHLAELVFAAGAGDSLVAVSSYSNYPEAVTALPVIGDAFMIDQEQLALLQPDLLLAWESGTPAHVVDNLREAGYRVEVIRTRGLDDVAKGIERIGKLTGFGSSAGQAANEYRQQLQKLRERWSDAAPLRVFYQVSSRPLYTINGEHYVSQLIELCGGQNIFAELTELAPMVTEESVIDRDPEVMLAAGIGSDTPFAVWERWSTMSANRYSNHFLVSADEIGRAAPRLVEAGAQVCARLQNGREQRAAAGG